jgi:AraC family transcriptional regulator of adaptative response/methylated-DNA-[protein]-cysteine methyltransferase
MAPASKLAARLRSFVMGRCCPCTDEPVCSILAVASIGYDRKMRMVGVAGHSYGGRMELDDGRWQAIQNRDAEATFLYGVATTGVYCRPSCPSRRPQRANVSLFDSASTAESAGFRPCKRCDPTGPGTGQRHADLVANACRLIEESEDPPDLATMAAAIGMSPFHFHRVFKTVTGLTPKGYADAARDERTRARLTGGTTATVTDAIYESGFGSSGHFYATATRRLGMTPKRFRDGGTDEKIRFAVGECVLGSVLVAATDKGICAIQFGDDPDELLRDFQDRFAAAELVGADPGFEALVASVVALVERADQAADLPLDIRGTTFQQRVWQALRAIPAGTTVTYQELARRIGAPTSARAVAAACAANTIAVAIPCHRVVRTDGSLSGYRWGIERKRALLQREQAI